MIDSVIMVQCFRTYTNHCLTKGKTRPVEQEVSQDLYSSCYVRRPMVDLRDFSTLNTATLLHIS